jgi:dGTPase
MKATLPGEGIRRKKEELVKWDMRDAFSIDVDRILHSQAYTSYTDKTQVFYLVGHQGISYRVIHVQLLSRIARTIGRKLGLNNDLIEAIAIGHDVGHPPFGHDGEVYLDKLCRASDIGGFRHNVHGIRALEVIEKGGKGLNLTMQVLDGILCHNGEMNEQMLSPEKTEGFQELEKKIRRAESGESPAPMTIEGCLVRMADTISYIGRDIEDAIFLGIISRDDLPRHERNILGDTNGKIVYTLVEDLIAHSKEGEIAYSSKVFNALHTLKSFNYEKIYLNPKVKSESNKIMNMYKLIFDRLIADIESHNKESFVIKDFVSRLGERYRKAHNTAEIARDYMASLTDSRFLSLFDSLFIPTMRG